MPRARQRWRPVSTSIPALPLARNNYAVGRVQPRPSRRAFFVLANIRNGLARATNGDAGGCPLLEGALTQPVTVTRRYWTELCFIKLPTIACNTSGLSLATFWNSASSEDSDAPGCFSIKSSISFSAASMVLDLSGVMISAF